MFYSIEWIGGGGLSRRLEQHEQRPGGWEQPGVLRTAQSWVGLGFTGLVTDIQSGTGRDLSRPVREPRKWEAGDPLLLYPAGQARLSAELGGIQGLEPGARRESKAVGPAEFLIS